MRSRNGRGPVKHEHPVAVLDPATQFQGGGGARSLSENRHADLDRVVRETKTRKARAGFCRRCPPLRALC
jgi:hypothetical protein